MSASSIKKSKEKIYTFFSLLFKNKNKRKRKRKDPAPTHDANAEEEEEEEEEIQTGSVIYKPSGTEKETDQKSNSEKGYFLDAFPRGNKVWESMEKEDNYYPRKETTLIKKTRCVKKRTSLPPEFMFAAIFPKNI